MLRIYDYSVHTVKKVFEILSKMMDVNVPEDIPKKVFNDIMLNGKNTVDFRTFSNSYGVNITLWFTVNTRKDCVTVTLDHSLTPPDRSKPLFYEEAAERGQEEMYYKHVQFAKQRFETEVNQALSHGIWNHTTTLPIFEVSFVRESHGHEIFSPESIFLHGEDRDDVKQYVDWLMEENLFLDTYSPKSRGAEFTYKVLSVRER